VPSTGIATASGRDFLATLRLLSRSLNSRIRPLLIVDISEKTTVGGYAYLDVAISYCHPQHSLINRRFEEYLNILHLDRGDINDGRYKIRVHVGIFSFNPRTFPNNQLSLFLRSVLVVSEITIHCPSHLSPHHSSEPSRRQQSLQKELPSIHATALQWATRQSLGDLDSFVANNLCIFSFDAVKALEVLIRNTTQCTLDDFVWDAPSLRALLSQHVLRTDCIIYPATPCRISSSGLFFLGLDTNERYASLDVSFPDLHPGWQQTLHLHWPAYGTSEAISAIVSGLPSTGMKIIQLRYRHHPFLTTSNVYNVTPDALTLMREREAYDDPIWGKYFSCVS